MVLHLVPSEDLRVACRQRIEACELWLRRLAHEQLTHAFSASYLEATLASGQPLFPADVRKNVEGRRVAEPARYPRPVDALVLGELAKLVCKPDVYKPLFACAFKSEFASVEHLRLVLLRLTDVRNALAHAGPLAVTHAERVLAYCTDISSALSAYYASSGMKDEFDAPSFVRFSDSLGHVAHPAETQVQLNYADAEGDQIRLRCGDEVRLEVEVDPRFAAEDYDVRWDIVSNGGVDVRSGSAIAMTLTSAHVGKSAFVVFASVTSTKAWHRHGKFDAQLVLVYSVLPPL